MKKSLICITTCKRLLGLKTLLPDYIAFCNNNPAYDFLVSLDGEDKAYLDFFSQFDIPAIYSETQEGVGLSKNRVIETFSEYDYYFFIDDDVELIDHSIFDIHIDVSDKTGIHHFSSGESYQFFGNIKKTKFENFTIIHSDFGSGAFNFFTAEGIKKVGGWHTDFAKYKRFGHTEYSYRFLLNRLAPSPFNYIEDTANHIRIHYPDHVVDPAGYYIHEGGIAKVEDDIVKQELKFFPVTTLCTYQYNNKLLSLQLEYPYDIQGAEAGKPSLKISRNPYLSENEKYLALEQEYTKLSAACKTMAVELQYIHNSASFKAVRKIITVFSNVRNWF